MIGTQRTTRSPSSSSTRRMVVWVAGCCGPKLSVQRLLSLDKLGVARGFSSRTCSAPFSTVYAIWRLRVGGKNALRRGGAGSAGLSAPSYRGVAMSQARHGVWAAELLWLPGVFSPQSHRVHRGTHRGNDKIGSV